MPQGPHLLKAARTAAVSLRAPDWRLDLHCVKGWKAGGQHMRLEREEMLERKRGKEGKRKGYRDIKVEIKKMEKKTG